MYVPFILISSNGFQLAESFVVGNLVIVAGCNRLTKLTVLERLDGTLAGGKKKHLENDFSK